MTEKHKLRYLQRYLARTNESRVDRFVNAMQDLEEKTRKCYAESIGLEKDAFVRMMLLDGFFIIEFFYKLVYEEITFFFSHLFSQSSTYSDASDVPRENVKHLLGLVHDTWCSSFKTTVSSRRAAEDQERTWEYIKCSTQLREAGVKFKKATETSSLLDIEFENGIMKILPLSVYDSTEVVGEAAWFSETVNLFLGFLVNVRPKMSQTIDHIALSIDQELACLPPTPLNPCIFKVYRELRIENEKAYEPKLITIGPFHHGKDNLQEMEEHKMCCFIGEMRRV
ncbi:unnamed protein product [Ilex paraguariensis]|uniref:Uncharacterized protein n=1 Tax=Ilex paraguariensis TaxID=185542 RepID=A0ABC8TU06_9AQUA